MDAPNDWLTCSLIYSIFYQFLIFLFPASQLYNFPDENMAISIGQELSLMTRIQCKFLWCLLLGLSILPGISPVSAEIYDHTTAELFGDQDDSPKITFGRSPRHISEVAENVTVITREDIKRLQARTLDELLQYYTGVLPYMNRMPGDLAMPMVQGLPYQNTLVAIDGIPMNSLSEGLTDTGIIGLSAIERVEIVKGPASSVWGRSVGAVINLITIEPEENAKASGGIRLYHGSNGTQGLEGQVGGTYGSTGYFLAGQYNASNGFQPNVNVNQGNYYGKLRHHLGSKATVSFLYGQTSAKRDLFASQELNATGSGIPEEAQYYALKLHAKPAAGSEFDATLYRYRFSIKNEFRTINPVFPILPAGNIVVARHSLHEESSGLHLSYTLKEQNHWFTAGLDGLFGSSRITDFTLFPAPANISKKRHPTQMGTYLSGGWRPYEPLTLTASVRYDHNTTSQDTVSPTLGIIYKLDDQTVLRASGSHGYSLPSLSYSSTKLARLWRVQIGLETNHIPGLWWKTNLFYDRASDIKLHLFLFDLWPEKDSNLTRRGVETEVRTLPVYNTTFSAGYTLLDIYDRDSGTIVPGLPRHHLLLNANYRNKGTDALLVGRYIFWNYPGGRDAMIFDLLLTQRLYSGKSAAISLQLGLHNIFDGTQYSTPFFANQPRWLEGGLRIEF